MPPTHPEPRDIPTAARNLGYAGLLPFVACTMGVWLAEETSRGVVMHALLTYSAVILSFMGAVHWGFALRPAALESAEPAQGAARLSPTRMLIISVMPALIAWAALSMAPGTALLVMAGAFVALASIDHRLCSDGIAPGWYWRLRLPLTTIAVLCLLAALAKEML